MDSLVAQFIFKRAISPDMELKSNSAVCLNPNCGGEYFAEKVEGGWVFKLKISEFECVNCGSLTAR